MKKLNTVNEYKPDQKLRSILQKRKAPLAPAAMNQTLQDLTSYIAVSKITFLMSAFIKKEKLTAEELTVDDIDRLDIMIGDDDERYLPVFTDPALFSSFKKELGDHEMLFEMTKQELFSLLLANEKIAACVVNPMSDDLLLYRVILQNMIAVEQNESL